MSEDGRFGARFVLGGDNEEHPKSVDTSRHKVKGVECFVGSRGNCCEAFCCSVLVDERVVGGWYRICFRWDHYVGYLSFLTGRQYIAIGSWCRGNANTDFTE